MGGDGHEVKLQRYPGKQTVLKTGGNISPKKNFFQPFKNRIDKNFNFSILLHK
jgi:hypothetical protein